MRYSYFFIVLIFTSILSCNPQPKKPDILFIFTDDQSTGTINALGNPEIHTPNLDALVNTGISFSNAYIMGGSSPAVCSPSRASLFSGLTLWNLENQGKWGFEISEKYTTLPRVFLENGYNTFATGKNEPGRKGHFARSFSAGDKILFRGMTGSQYKLPLNTFSPEGDYSPEREVLHEGIHSAKLYADACIRFIEEQAESDKPFFAYVAFQTPHDPKQAPPEFREMYNENEIKLPAAYLPRHPFDNGMLDIRDEQLAGFPRSPEEIKKHIAEYYAEISHTDAQIGRITEALRRTGRFDNTIIVFTSDNGLALGKHGLMGKQNVYEHSVKVPFIIAGPGISEGETREQLCYIYDIYPTLCEKAGLPTPETVQFKSLINVIDGQEDIHRDHLYFAFMSWQRAIRDEQFKLIEYSVENKRYTQFFDLKNDPHEMKNLAGDQDYNQELNRLRTILEKERVLQNDGKTPYDFTDAQGKLFWKTYENAETTEFPEFDF